MSIIEALRQRHPERQWYIVEIEVPIDLPVQAQASRIFAGRDIEYAQDQ